MRLSCIVAIGIGLAGCGTVTRGTTETVAFASEPPGAEVRTSLGNGCPATPCSLDIARKTEFTATFRLPGYAEASIPVVTKVSGGGGASMAGNVLIGGIDAYNGTALDHDPNPVVAAMKPLRGSGPRRGRRAPRTGT